MSSTRKLRNAGLSDLFFNYQHDNYDRVLGRYQSNKTNPNADPVPDTEIREALILDAEDFITTMDAFLAGEDLLIDAPATATELVDDFLARL